MKLLRLLLPILVLPLMAGDCCSLPSVVNMTPFAIHVVDANGKTVVSDLPSGRAAEVSGGTAPFTAVIVPGQGKEGRAVLELQGSGCMGAVAAILVRPEDLK